MSAALKMAQAQAGIRSGGAFAPRSQFVGDPGLFGFLGSVVKKVGGLIPGPIGALTGLIPGGGGTQEVRPRGFAPQQIPSRVNPPFFGPRGVGLSLGEQETAAMNGGPPGVKPAGHHANKSTYFLKDGTRILKNTVWVKDRRTNPLNPRALSRSIRRIEGAKRKEETLKRITIRCKRCGKANCTCR